MSSDPENAASRQPASWAWRDRLVLPLAVAIVTGGALAVWNVTKTVDRHEDRLVDAQSRLADLSATGKATTGHEERIKSLESRLATLEGRELSAPALENAITNLREAEITLRSQVEQIQKETAVHTNAISNVALRVSELVAKIDLLCSHSAKAETRLNEHERRLGQVDGSADARGRTSTSSQ